MSRFQFLDVMITHPQKITFERNARIRREAVPAV